MGGTAASDLACDDPLAMGGGTRPPAGWCGGHFQYGETPVWMIRNTTYDGCGAGTQDVRGDGRAVDAVTGGVSGWFNSSSIVECG